MADLGANVLDSAMVETSAYVLCKNSKNASFFFRALAYSNKELILKTAISTLHRGRGNEILYILNTMSLRQIPGSPFAYWVNEQIRKLFVDLPPFESDGREARIGLQTSDDFRFARTWWEIDSTKIIVCNRYDMTPDEYRFQTFQGKKWALYNKGGAYSPFYSDIDLVVNWENDGKEIWNFVDETGFRLSRPRGGECYFKPGLSWALRTRLFSPYVVPAGCILSLSRYEIFACETELEWILGLLNGSPVTLLLKISSERYEHPKFIEGIVAKLPFPNPSREEKEKLKQLARNAIRCVKHLLSVNETSHLFRTIGVLYSKDGKLAERALEWQTTVEALHEELIGNQQDIDRIVCHLYGIQSTDRSLKEVETFRTIKNFNNLSNIEGNESEDEVEKIETSYSGLTGNLISYSLGCVFGRWDIRIGLNPTLVPKSYDSFTPLPICSPGTLINPNALPASSNYIVSEEWLHMRTDSIKLPQEDMIKQPTVADEEYPVRIAWDGFLVDDPGHSSDIVQRIREVLAILWSSSSGTQAEEIEHEICEILAVKELREYAGEQYQITGGCLCSSGWPLETRPRPAAVRVHCCSMRS